MVNPYVGAAHEFDSRATTCMHAVLTVIEKAMNLSHTLEMSDRPPVQSMASSVVDIECTYAAAFTRSVNQLHVLLRKEVIQPHLPIRLPCYDFVPLT